MLIFLFVIMAFGMFEETDSFTEKKLKQRVHYISSEIGPRPTGSLGDSLIQSYLIRTFKDMGLNPKKQFIGNVGEPPLHLNFVNSSNVIATVKGVDTTHSIILGAHHDTVNDKVIGANDNATGLAVLLELADYFSKNKPQQTLHFVAFAAEEIDLLGARFFVENFSGMTSVKAMINFDMLGRGEILLGANNQGVPQWNVEFVAEAVRALGLKSVNLDNTFFAGASLFGAARGDHAAFTARGLPALSFSSRIIPGHYHTHGDTPEYVHYKNLYDVFQLSKEIIKTLFVTEKLDPSSNYLVIPIPFTLQTFIVDYTVGFIGVLYLMFFLLVRTVKTFKALKNEGEHGWKNTVSFYIPFLVFLLSFVLSETILSASYEALYWTKHPYKVFLFSLSSGVLTALISFYFYKPSNVFQLFICFVCSLFLALLAFLFTTSSLLFYLLLVYLLLCQMFLVKKKGVQFLYWLISLALFYSMFSVHNYSYLIIDADLELGFIESLVILFLLLSPFYFSFLMLIRSLSVKRVYLMIGAICLFFLSLWNVSEETYYSDDMKPLYSLFSYWKKSSDDSQQIQVYLKEDQLKQKLIERGTELNEIMPSHGDWSLFEMSYPKASFLTVGKRTDVISESTDSLKLKVVVDVRSEVVSPYFRYTYVLKKRDDASFSKVMVNKTIYASGLTQTDSVEITVPKGMILNVKVEAHTSDNVFSFPVDKNKRIVTTTTRLVSEEKLF